MRHFQFKEISLLFLDRQVQIRTFAIKRSGKKIFIHLKSWSLRGNAMAKN